MRVLGRREFSGAVTMNRATKAVGLEVVFTKTKATKRYSKVKVTKYACVMLHPMMVLFRSVKFLFHEWDSNGKAEKVVLMRME